MKVKSEYCLVSVVIPCYNVEDYIDGCLESVFGQTYSNLEVICVDNNSTDNTRQKLDNWREKIIVESESTKGACAARNKGLSLAKGKLIQFLDADDLLMEDKIKTQLDLLGNNENFSFIAGASIKRKLGNFDKKILVGCGTPFHNLFLGKLGNTCSNLWNAEDIKEINGWNEKLMSSQETELMFRLLKKNGNVLYDTTHSTIVQERSSGQISTMDIRGNLKRYIEIRGEILSYLSGKGEDAEEYYQFLFDKLRELYPFYSSFSIEFFENHFRKTFSPSNYLVNSKLYRILFRIFGFKYTESIKGFFNK